MFDRLDSIVNRMTVASFAPVPLLVRLRERPGDRREKQTCPGTRHSNVQPKVSHCRRL